MQKQTCIPFLKDAVSFICDSISKTRLILDSAAGCFRGRQWKSIRCLEFPVSKEISVRKEQKKKRDLSIWNAQPAQSSCFSNSLCYQRCGKLTWSHSAPYRSRGSWAVEPFISRSACHLVFYLTCYKAFSKESFTLYMHTCTSFHIL